MFRPELLSPAGSMEALRAAVSCGCDAVYVGGKNYSARQSASNFDLIQINEAVDFCHLRGVKLYLAVNTLIKDRECDDFFKYIENCLRFGVDSLIVQDLGVAVAINEFFPGAILHASTQMTVQSLDGVNFLAENNFNRVVLSRELSLKEIKFICSNSNIQIECFVHGALCTCFSGQCLMSSVIGKRSANRGRCAQPCRLRYALLEDNCFVTDGYLLSSKDIATVSILPLLINSGIYSFKIEGRMKNTEYVAGVTYIYRKYIDLFFNDGDEFIVDDNDVKFLLQLFNRGGFSRGSYLNTPDLNSMSLVKPKNWGVFLGTVLSVRDKSIVFKTSEDIVPGDGIEIWDNDENSTGLYMSKHYLKGAVVKTRLNTPVMMDSFVYKTYDKVLSDTLKKYIAVERKIPIRGRFTAKINEKCTLELFYNDLSIMAVGTVVEVADNRPLTEDVVKDKLSKMGGTTFVLDVIDLIIDNNVFLNVSDINALRREACEMLAIKILSNARKSAFHYDDGHIRHLSSSCSDFYSVLDKKLSVLVQNKKQFNAVCASSFVTRIYVELSDEFLYDINYYIDCCTCNNIELFAALPFVDGDLDFIYDLNVSGFLVRTYGQYYRLHESGKKIVIDKTFNVFNSYGVDFWTGADVDTITLSIELSIYEINEIAKNNCEIIVYGQMPLMVTRNCPVGLYSTNDKKSHCHCSEKKDYYLLDRKGNKLPVINNCFNCYALILNHKMLFMLNSYEEIKDSAPSYVRLEFRTEDVEIVTGIVNSYGNLFCADGNANDTSIKNIMDYFENNGFTKGYFFNAIG